MTSQTSEASWGLISVSSSFFCIWMRSFPSSFSMMRTLSSSNPMSSLSKGISYMYFVSPLSAE
ncbi:MAG: hypothetical protein IKP53_05720 [Candidatus Methanomethylophilaceae archaeon]|nr:hypothetical protein [Candidatus Methanomethylophilaceae archaeon]